MSIPFIVCVDISNEIEKVDELVNKPTPSRFNLRIIANVTEVDRWCLSSIVHSPRMRLCGAESVYS